MITVINDSPKPSLYIVVMRNYFTLSKKKRSSEILAVFMFAGCLYFSFIGFISAIGHLKNSARMDQKCL